MTGPSRATLAVPLAIACATLVACASAPAPRIDAASAAVVVDVPAIARPAGETPAWWYRSGAARAAGNGAMGGRAKNVIVFLGDGMSLTTVAAARIFAGQQAGNPGEEHLLAWEHFPATAFSKTYNTDAQTPDSAGTMTAVATGVKTHIGAIGVSAGGHNDCAQSRGNRLQGWLALAADAGMGTGIVTTARLTHATPAATYAHVPNRNWESDATLPDAARAAGCTDIASQFIDFVRDRGAPQVVLAGGARAFLPAEEVLPGVRGKRRDGRNLVAEWQALHPEGAFVHDTRQFEAARGASPVLGLFESSHMQYEHDRDRGPEGEPDLEAMTRFAIESLARNDAGYVLLVESGRIDHANHEGNAYRALDETVAMSRAVQAAVDMTSADDTLIVVTADHSHVLNFAGYPRRGNPILGKVHEKGDGPALDALGLPYTTLSYANGPGYPGASATQPEGPKRHYHAAKGVVAAAGRPDLSSVDTTHPDYMQEALVPLESETHGGEDVGIWARGPGSAAFRGTLEQNVIYHVIVQATPALRERLCAIGNCDPAGVPVELPSLEAGRRGSVPR
ncbi:alkaline phosphatase [Luteimonas sp. MC1572]|uniref:alkaline phosphatase n=1 Tax=Luteimonas sp. MC1572 TaxID=2799325 RepID=UPI0018F07EF6|nr:alkaline phosphatase [Luteimonas sp. MC1572]MBJ6982704.1 alkaline phosphatase [Luteimonas sp. MC1572]QQO03945.1 alkaline phosphatase [Luteimonas sp. MC1572]